MQFPSALNFTNPDHNEHSDSTHSQEGSSASSRDGGDRLRIAHLANSSPPSTTALDDVQAVLQGLTQPQKTLPPRFFYDDRGSQLFEQICQLPEYYLTRTETSIFQSCADDIAQLTGACELVELGSGSSTKTRIILDAYARHGLPLRYVPIDVSAGILKGSAQQLLADYPDLKIYGLVGTYQQALHMLMPSTLPSRMIAFIGSTLGNLSPEECDQFLAQISNALNPGEYFLLGIDLQKDKSILEAAYNDSQGVTAAFNLNMLHHLNRRFSANFNVSQFAHVAFYNEACNQIEMHLRSLTDQVVHLEALNIEVQFEQGETIHSEVSRKFDVQQMDFQLRSHNLNTVRVWTDPKQWFGVMLAQRQV